MYKEWQKNRFLSCLQQKFATIVMHNKRMCLCMCVCVIKISVSVVLDNQATCVFRRRAIRLLRRTYGSNGWCGRCDLALDWVGDDDDCELESNTSGANWTLLRGQIKCLSVFIARSIFGVCINRSLAKTISRLPIECGNSMRVDKAFQSISVLPSTLSL